MIARLTRPNDSLDPPKWLADMNAKVAMGMAIRQTKHGLMERGNGGWVAFTAGFRRLREKRLSSFVFCNTREVIAPRIANKVLKIYLEEISTGHQ